MYIKDARVFYCVMTYGLTREKGKQTIGFVVNLIHKYMVDITEELSNYRERPNSS